MNGPGPLTFKAAREKARKALDEQFVVLRELVGSPNWTDQRDPAVLAAFERLDGAAERIRLLNVSEKQA